MSSGVALLQAVPPAPPTTWVLFDITTLLSVFSPLEIVSCQEVHMPFVMSCRNSSSVGLTLFKSTIKLTLVISFEASRIFLKLFQRYIM